MGTIMKRADKKEHDRLLTKEQNLRHREHLLEAKGTEVQIQDRAPKKGAVSHLLQGTNRLQPGRDTTPPESQLQRKGLRKLRVLHRLVDKGWKILVEGLGVVTALFALWTLFAVQPTVHPPVDIDPQDVFRVPFSVSNDLDFFTLYDVHPVCGFDKNKDAPGFPLQDLSTEVAADIGDLTPKSPPAYFRCYGGGPSIPTVSGTKFYLTLTYAVRIFPGLYWHRKRESTYRVFNGGEGKPYWIEGEWLRR